MKKPRYVIHPTSYAGASTIVKAYGLLPDEWVLASKITEQNSRPEDIHLSAVEDRQYEICRRQIEERRELFRQQKNEMAGLDISQASREQRGKDFSR